MQMNGLGDSASNAAHARARYAAAKRAAAAAANQALLNVQLHNFYLAKLAAYTAASTAEAKALLGVATANAGTNQTAINQAVNTALICENNSLMAYADMSSAAQQDNTLQAQLKATAFGAAYTAAKAALLPFNGYWNTQSWQPQYVIDQVTYNALKNGKTIYNWMGATSVMLGRPVLCFCNGYFRANPKATLADINNYGGQLSAAAQSSDSFGSFLMGALPYIAIVAVIATAVVFTAGALAPAAASSLAPASAAGALTNSQIVAAGVAQGDAGGGIVAGVVSATPSVTASTSLLSSITSQIPSASTLAEGAITGIKTSATQLIEKALTPSTPASNAIASPSLSVSPATPVVKKSSWPLILGIGTALITFIR